jgi:hypothetical protein
MDNALLAVAVVILLAAHVVRWRARHELLRSARSDVRDRSRHVACGTVRPREAGVDGAHPAVSGIRTTRGFCRRGTGSRRCPRRATGRGGPAHR